MGIQRHNFSSHNLLNQQAGCRTDPRDTSITHDWEHRGPLGVTQISQYIIYGESVGEDETVLADLGKGKTMGSPY